MVEWLRQENRRSRNFCALKRRWIVSSRNEHYFEIGACGSKSPHKFRPAQTWHHDVSEDDIDKSVIAIPVLFSFPAIRGDQDAVSGRTEHLVHHSPHRHVIIDQQNRYRRAI